MWIKRERYEQLVKAEGRLQAILPVHARLQADYKELHDRVMLFMQIPQTAEKQVEIAKKALGLSFDPFEEVDEEGNPLLPQSGRSPAERDIQNSVEEFQP